MADLNQAQKSEIHETTDDAASSPASNFERGAADADVKRNPDATGAGADVNDTGNTDRGSRRGQDAAPPGAVIESDESDAGGPVRIRTDDADLKNQT